MPKSRGIYDLQKKEFITPVDLKWIEYADGLILTISNSYNTNVYSDSGELIMGYNGKKLRIENGSIYEDRKSVV